METSKTELLRVVELETWNPALFRDVLKAAAVVNEEPDIILDPEGLKITQMGPDHVCMVDLYLSRGFFDSFNVVEEYRASLNLKDLNKLLFNRKTGKLKDSSLSIHIEGYKATFKGSGKLSGVKTFNLGEPQEEETPTPKLVYDAKVTLVTDTLKKVIDDCTVNHNVIITVDSDKVIFRCANDDYLEESTIDKYDDNILELYAAETQKAIYELEHLAKFPRALVKIAEVVTLEFSIDLPMRISADLPYESHLIYYIAPKIHPGGEPEDPDPHKESEAIPEPEVVDVDTVDLHEDPAEIVEPVIEVPEEIPTVEAAPDPHEDQPSLGELYLQYYAEALARHSAEAA